MCDQCGNPLFREESQTCTPCREYEYATARTRLWLGAVATSWFQLSFGARNIWHQLNPPTWTHQRPVHAD